MKRYALMLAVITATAGCWSDPSSTPTKSTSATPPAPHAAVAPGASMPERKLKGYFEIQHDGKMYVVEDYASVRKVQAGDMSGKWAKEWTDANGKTAVFQDDGAGLAMALQKEYEKSHPKMAK